MSKIAFSLGVFPPSFSISEHVWGLSKDKLPLLHSVTTSVAKMPQHNSSGFCQECLHFYVVFRGQISQKGHLLPVYLFMSSESSPPIPSAMLSNPHHSTGTALITTTNDFQVFKCGCQLSYPVSLEPLCFCGSMTSS